VANSNQENYSSFIGDCSNTKQQTKNTEHKTPNTEHKTQNTKQRTQNKEQQSEITREAHMT